MQNLPTEDRPSTKILEDLIQVRKRLVAIEGVGNRVFSIHPKVHQIQYLKSQILPDCNRDQNGMQSAQIARLRGSGWKWIPSHPEPYSTTGLTPFKVHDFAV